MSLNFQEYDLGDSCYGGSKMIYVSQHEHLGNMCNKCKKRVYHVPVMRVDSSNGEYEEVAICKECVIQIFDEYEKTQ
jgi:hypothetical protein